MDKTAHCIARARCQWQPPPTLATTYKDRIEESMAQDSADGNDSCSFESLIFPVLLYLQLYRTSELRRGYGRLQGVQAADQRRDTMGVPVPQYYEFRRGCVWKSEHGAILPHGGGHRRATLAAPKGE